MRRWSTSFFYVLLRKSYRRKSLSPSTFRPWLSRLTSIGGCFPNGFSTAKLSGRSLFPNFGAYGGVGMPLLFDHAGPNVCSTVMKIVGFFREIGPWFPSPHRRSVNFNDFGLSYTVGFFYGACSEGLYGCGATILMQAGLQYHFHWSAGARSSSRAKLVAVWGIVRCASWLEIDEMEVAGDSNCYRLGAGLFFLWGSCIIQLDVSDQQLQENQVHSCLSRTESVCWFSFQER